MMHLQGILSDNEIKNSILAHEINIIPYSEQSLTGMGYNLTPSNFVFSTQKGFAEIIRKSSEGRMYIQVSSNDTVLILTKESIEFSSTIVGTIHARVKIVSRGFGHISTTIDPNWSGPLLISLTNPTNKKLKIYLDETFCTVLIHKLSSPSEKKHDNPPARIDILENYISTPPRWFISLFYYKKYNEFSKLVLSLRNLLPLCTQYNTPLTIRLLELKNRYSELYEQSFDKSILFEKKSRILVDDIACNQKCFSDYIFTALKQSTKTIENMTDINTLNIEEIQGELYKIKMLIQLEIDTEQYREYLEVLSSKIPQMQPKTLRIIEWLNKRFLILLTFISLLASIIIPWIFPSLIPQEIYMSIPATTAVMSLFAFYIYRK